MDTVEANGTQAASPAPLTREQPAGRAVPSSPRLVAGERRPLDVSPGETHRCSGDHVGPTSEPASGHRGHPWPVSLHEHGELPQPIEGDSKKPPLSLCLCLLPAVHCRLREPNHSPRQAPKLEPGRGRDQDFSGVGDGSCANYHR